MELDQNLLVVNNNEVAEKQNKFLETNIGKIINSTLDIGLKYFIPDIIENEIINVKDAFLANGWESGLKQIINEGINFGKSAIGIVTGKFDNVEQMEKAVERGGILDAVSNFIDKIMNKGVKTGKISPKINDLISIGKDVLVKNIETNIENMFNNQKTLSVKIQNTMNDWRSGYMQKDFGKMEEKYNEIKSMLRELAPIEKLIKEMREIENLHKLIKNKGEDFNLSESEMELSKILTM